MLQKKKSRRLSKRAKWKGVSDKDKHPALHKMCKKSGRSSGPLVPGINGVMVTPKVYKSQQRRK